MLSTKLMNQLWTVVGFKEEYGKPLKKNSASVLGASQLLGLSLIPSLALLGLKEVLNFFAELGSGLKNSRFTS